MYQVRLIVWDVLSTFIPSKLIQDSELEFPSPSLSLSDKGWEKEMSLLLFFLFWLGLGGYNQQCLGVPPGSVLRETI